MNEDTLTSKVLKCRYLAEKNREIIQLEFSVKKHMGTHLGIDDKILLELKGEDREAKAEKLVNDLNKVVKPIFQKLIDENEKEIKAIIDGG